MNKVNLKKGEATRFTSGERAVECGRKGGIESQKQRKLLKTFRECVEDIIDSREMNEDRLAMLSTEFELDEVEITNRLSIAAALIEKSKNANDSGQIAAIKELRAILGEDKDDAENNKDLNINIQNVSPNEYRR